MSSYTLSLTSWQIVPQILEILQTKWPDTKTGYNALKGYWELQAKFPARNYYLLTPDGKVDKFGTFVLCIPVILDVHMYMYIETLNPDDNLLCNALAECKDINWNQGIEIQTVHQRHFSTVEKLNNYLKLEIEICATSSLHIESSIAKEIILTLPDEVYLKTLDESNAYLINSVWPHAIGEATVPLVEEYVTNRKSFGLFKKKNSQLVGWCLHLEYGGPGLLQVLPEERGKGYGEILLRAMTKHLGDNEIDSHAFVMLNNVASNRLFKKVGYTESYLANYYKITPPSISDRTHS